MIRLAVDDDFNALVDMGMEASSTIPRYDGVIVPNRESMEQLFRNLLTNPSVFFAVLGPVGEPYGMLPATVSLHPITGERTIFAHFWWVDPKKRGHGLDLLRAYFAWGKEMQVTSYQIGGSSRRVARLYYRFGFKKIEELFALKVK